MKANVSKRLSRQPNRERPFPDHLWRHWPLLTGVVALLAYLFTLAPGAYPGIPTDLLASVAGVIPEHPAGHPVWFLLARGLAHLPLLDLPLRLNLFSAFCGAGVVALFSWLVSWFIFVMAREDGGGNNPVMIPEADDADSAPVVVSMDPIAVAHNRLASQAALLGGCVAGLALAFCIPFWSAATRFSFQSFDLLLLVIVLLLFRRYLCARYPSPVASLIALLCGLGCVETEIFFPLSAALTVFYTLHLARLRKAWDRLLPSALLMAGLGALLGLLLLFLSQSTDPSMHMGFQGLISNLLRSHYQAIRGGLPHKGWIWILLLAYTPAIIALSTARAAFANRDLLTHMVMNQLFTVIALLCLFNASFSPWGLARMGDHLPVIPYLAVALIAGYLAAFWRMLGAPDDLPDDVPDVSQHKTMLGTASGLDFWKKLAPSFFFRRIASTGITWLILVLVCVTPLLNLREANGRASAFADAVARELLPLFGDRDWVASRNPLDRHLQMLAHEQGRTLRLLPPTDKLSARNTRQLQSWIAADPVLRAHRDRLNIAAEFGAQTFFLEWLKIDRSAEAKLVASGLPIVWQRAGWQPVPLGIGYAGVAQLESLRGVDLLRTNRAFWARMDKLLAPEAREAPLLDSLRHALRQQISRVANDLGVLLQDQGRNEDAYETYQTARRFNAGNLSALINLYFLTESGPHQKEQRTVRSDIGELLGQFPEPPPLSRVVETHGEIRNATALTAEGHNWSLRGQPTIARNELERALSLSPGGAKSTELQLASFFLSQGNTNRSVQIYRTLLAANPADAHALLGLASVALIGGHTADAQRWLDQARAAGASSDALLLCTASLLIQTGKFEEAGVLLQPVTDRHPENIEAWSLQADALLRRKNYKEVEQRVLPAVWKALGRHDHVLIHILRAKLLVEKTPPDFALARDSYLHALGLRPDLVGVRNDLLLLDLATSNLANMEADATMVFRADPDDAMANYLLAAVALERNDLPRAETFFRRSFATQKYPGALNDFAEMLHRQNRLAEAEKSAREALAQNGRLYQAWDTLGRILLDAGRPDEAAHAVEQALTLCTSDARVYVSLALARFAQKRTDEARSILRGIPAKCPSIPANAKAEIDALEQRISRNASAPASETAR